MKKYIFLFVFSFLIVAGWLGMQFFAFNDGKLHLIFCNVGQGDAIFIKTAQNSQILIDSGPDSSVLDCIKNHSPFWKKEINIAILTHPHADHLNGFIKVFQNYKIDAFITERLANTTLGYTQLSQTINNMHIQGQIVLQGDMLKSQNFSLFFVGPSDMYLERTSPHGNIGETGEFGSLETLVKYGNFTALLTGDSQVAELKEALGSLRTLGILGKLNILQVPHHGSRFGLDKGIIDILYPQLAVISVGANNKYGHPAKETLGLLGDMGIPVLRTDKRGDIEIVTDGEKWWIK